MCELSGLSYAQVAEALNIPIGTVGSRRSLAMAALAKQLEDL
jgi:DNA-directed RNA polymerase specialized sigma24 family protein